MSDLTDYIDRVYDVLAYAGATPAGDTLLTQELVLENESGQICVGAQLLAQRFLLEILTEKGSMVYRPTRGTDFMAQLRQGYLRTPIDVFAAFSSALVDVQRNLQDDETNEPDDERYSSAQILSLTVLPGSVEIYVEITSLAGTSRKVILPIAVTPGG